MVIMAALIGSLGLYGSQADAAKDYLRMPAPEAMSVLTELQEKVTVQAPNAEVREVLNEYVDFALSETNKRYVLLNNRVMTGHRHRQGLHD